MPRACCGAYARGVSVHVEPMSGAIRSRRRFTYEEVDQYLADPEGLAIRSSIRKCMPCSAGCRSWPRSCASGALSGAVLELTMPEVKVDLDAWWPRDRLARLVQNTESHRIIEDFMLCRERSGRQSTWKRPSCSSSAACIWRDPHAEGAPPSSSLAWATRLRAWQAASNCRSCLPSHGLRRTAGGELRPASQSAARRTGPEKEGHYAARPATTTRTSHRQSAGIRTSRSSNT